MTKMITETCQYITFKLGEELFAINVDQVREVLEIARITSLPKAPDFVRGVINVRGKAIPVVDLRIRFGLPRATDTVYTRIIVLELVLNGEAIVLGGVADSVHEVIEIEPASIDPPPKIGMRWRTDFMQGMSRRGDEFIIVLDAKAVFSSEEAALLGEAARSAAGLDGD
jgi:purine-binding chemotaxis protein CheW